MKNDMTWWGTRCNWNWRLFVLLVVTRLPPAGYYTRAILRFQRLQVLHAKPNAGSRSSEMPQPFLPTKKILLPSTTKSFTPLGCPLLWSIASSIKNATCCVLCLFVTLEAACLPAEVLKRGRAYACAVPRQINCCFSSSDNACASSHNSYCSLQDSYSSLPFDGAGACGECIFDRKRHSPSFAAWWSVASCPWLKRRFRGA